jgi:hypothetical protein
MLARNRTTKVRICLGYAVGLIGLITAAHAADDTARFYGTWEGNILYNNQTLTIVSVHNASGYKNYMRLPNGNTPAGDGTFFAADGKYSTSAEKPNDSGVYRFIGCAFLYPGRDCPSR